MLLIPVVAEKFLKILTDFCSTSKATEWQVKQLDKIVMLVAARMITGLVALGECGNEV